MDHNALHGQRQDKLQRALPDHLIDDLGQKETVRARWPSFVARFYERKVNTRGVEREEQQQRLRQLEEE
eukprot:4555018-Karenia_brevis.AAC.1